jgi:molecular chaperone DnaK
MTWVLAVDFGTTNTVAAVADATGVRVLNVNGRPVMASAVFLHDDGWYVGDAAVRMARHRLDRFEACPKRAIPDQTLFLGGVDVPVADAITALFRPLLAEALEQHGGKPPDLFVVTHPATWTASRIELLLSAAAAAAPGKARWPNPQALAEPVAAAQRVLHLENMPATSRLVVLDLGGGTTDVTVVDRHGDRLNVVGNPLGHDGLGGVDFDLRLARWMVAEVNAPGLYDRLANASAHRTSRSSCHASRWCRPSCRSPRPSCRLTRPCRSAGPCWSH